MECNGVLLNIKMSEQLKQYIFIECKKEIRVGTNTSLNRKNDFTGEKHK